MTTKSERADAAAERILEFFEKHKDNINDGNREMVKDGISLRIMSELTSHQVHTKTCIADIVSERRKRTKSELVREIIEANIE